MKKTLIRDEDGITRTYPEIVLVDTVTDLPIAYTGLQYMTGTFNEILTRSESYNEKIIYNIITFLNFLLHETDVSKISQVDTEIIRQFLIWYKQTSSGSQKASNTWSVCMKNIYRFLNKYFFTFEGKADFRYSPTQLYKILSAEQSLTGTTTLIANNQGVRPPRKGRKKNRVIYGNHLDFLYYCAEKYDPMLLLPLKLEATGGLREGGPVNLTRSSIEIERTGIIGLAETRIKINLTENASFNTRRTRLTSSGNIKKFREQRIYPDFVDDVLRTYENHINLLDALCIKTGRKLGRDSDEPLLLNNYGQPMTVKVYQSRVKNLFYEHFLPELKAYCSKLGIWEENQPYIRQYEKEYPGLHMCRHWFTMYLITQTDCTEEEIVWWRGDKSLDAYHDYVHDTIDMQIAFKSCAFAFQKQVWEESNKHE